MTRPLLTLAALAAAVVAVTVARRTRVEVEDDAADLREFARHGAVVAKRKVVDR